MRVVRKIASLRHFVAISLLAVIMSIFSVGASKASIAKAQKRTDPVISSMTWESPRGHSVGVFLDDNVSCNGCCGANCTQGNEPFNCGGDDGCGTNSCCGINCLQWNEPVNCNSPEGCNNG